MNHQCNKGNKIVKCLCGEKLQIRKMLEEIQKYKLEDLSAKVNLKKVDANYFTQIRDKNCILCRNEINFKFSQQDNSIYDELVCPECRNQN